MQIDVMDSGPEGPHYYHLTVRNPYKYNLDPIQRSLTIETSSGVMHRYCAVHIDVLFSNGFELIGYEPIESGMGVCPVERRITITYSR